jgi:hypothetical protein
MLRRGARVFLPGAVVFNVCVMQNIACGFGGYWKTACQAPVAHLGGGGEDILLCKVSDVFDIRGVRLSFRMAASAAPVLNCMDDWRRAPSLPVMEREGRDAGFQRSPKASSGDVGFASRSLGGDAQALSFLRNGEAGRNGDDGRNLGEEGILMSKRKKGSKR